MHAMHVHAFDGMSVHEAGIGFLHAIQFERILDEMQLRHVFEPNQ